MARLGKLPIAVVSIAATLTLVLSDHALGSTTPTGPPAQFRSAVDIQDGTVRTLPLPEGLLLLEGTEYNRRDLAARGFSLFVEAGGRSVRLSADTGLSPRSSQLRVRGVGCTVSGCGVRLEWAINVSVIPPAVPTTSPISLAFPSGDRLALAASVPTGGVRLLDELWVQVEDDEPTPRNVASAAAATVGGVVTGGDDVAGIYQLRTPRSADLLAAKADVGLVPGVDLVLDAVWGDTEQVDAAVPTEWLLSPPSESWSAQVINAPALWQRVQGESVMVGVVEAQSAWSGHEDLGIVEVDLDYDYGDPESHPTFVAGVACARPNGIGVAGTGLGCQVASIGVSPLLGEVESDLQIHVGIRNAIRAGARVVNVSMGEPTACGAGDNLEFDPSAVEWYRSLMAGVGRDVIFTFSAGNNCSLGPSSARGAAASQVDNALVVASVNSDGALSSFSNYGPGVHVAAGGGVSAGSDQTPIRSTSIEWCEGQRCSGYTNSYGTSFAAPAVAGIASLLMAEAPLLPADVITRCIKDTAGSSTGIAHIWSNSPSGPPSDPFRYVSPAMVRRRDEVAPATPIVDADAALDCVYEASAPPPPGVFTTGLRLGDVDNFGFGTGFPIGTGVPVVDGGFGPGQTTRYYWPLSADYSDGLTDREFTGFFEKVDEWRHVFTIPSGFEVSRLEVEVNVMADRADGGPYFEFDGTRVHLTEAESLTDTTTGAVNTALYTFVFEGAAAHMAQDGVINALFSDYPWNVSYDFVRLRVTSTDGRVLEPT